MRETKNLQVALSFGLVLYFSMSLVQNQRGFPYLWAYNIFQFLVMGALLVFLLRNSFLLVHWMRTLAVSIKSIPLHPLGKWTLGLWLGVQFMHVFLGKQYYPFADVGMWRKASLWKDHPHRVYMPKYFYFDAQQHVRIVEPRKEHVFFVTKDFEGVSFDQFFSLSVARANLRYRENYEYLRIKLRPFTDHLYLGLHVYDFRTHEEEFVTDQNFVTAQLGRVYRAGAFRPDFDFVGGGIHEKDGGLQR
jgi:hypothetical protein